MKKLVLLAFLAATTGCSSAMLPSASGKAAIVSVEPSSVVSGRDGQTIVITADADAFTGDSTVVITRDGNPDSSVTVSKATVVTPSRMELTLAVANDAPAGVRTIAVGDAEGSEISIEPPFDAFAPALEAGSRVFVALEGHGTQWTSGTHFVPAGVEAIRSDVFDAGSASMLVRSNGYADAGVAALVAQTGASQESNSQAIAVVATTAAEIAGTTTSTASIGSPLDRRLYHVAAAPGSWVFVDPGLSSNWPSWTGMGAAQGALVTVWAKNGSVIVEGQADEDVHGPLTFQIPADGEVRFAIESAGNVARATREGQADVAGQSFPISFDLNVTVIP